MPTKGLLGSAAAAATAAVVGTTGTGGGGAGAMTFVGSGIVEETICCEESGAELGAGSASLVSSVSMAKHRKLNGDKMLKKTIFID